MKSDSLVKFMVVAGAFWAACGPQGRAGVAPSGALPSMASDDPNGVVDPTGPGEATCQNQQFAPQKAQEPDIMLIQDSSGSMADGTPSKYDQVVGAVSTVIGTLNQQAAPVNWGLIMFPTDGDCGVNAIPKVMIGMNEGPAVIAAIKGQSPDGSTPLTQAVKVATNYYQGLDDARAHYLLVATDGEPNCDGNDIPKSCTANTDCDPNYTCQTVPIFGGFCVESGGGPTAAAIQAALALGIKTYVVGIDLGGDSSTLDSLAAAGGTARSGSPQYYSVTDQSSLEGALTNIATQLISCSFTLNSLPDSKAAVEVSVGGTTVYQDKTHADGWDVDSSSKTLTFYGSSCTKLQTSGADVKVGYTCPPPM